MLQEGGFPSELTVAETVRMWAGCTSGARPMGEALDTVGLSRRADIRVKQLSGGEKRRLDLALALLGRPEVLFLDEPTTGLDAEGRRDTWQLARALRDTGTTVLLTTHYLEEPEELADRLAILHEGRIAAHGRLSDVIAQQPSQISFELPEGYTVEHLPALASLGVIDVDGPGAPGETTRAAARGSDRTAEPAGGSASGDARNRGPAGRGTGSREAASPGGGSLGTGGRGTARGRRVRLRTNELQRAATRLLVWAEQAGVELTGLDIRSASLEEVFLGIAREAGRASALPAEAEDTRSDPTGAGRRPSAGRRASAGTGTAPEAGSGERGEAGSGQQGTGGAGATTPGGRKRRESAV